MAKKSVPSFAPLPAATPAPAASPPPAPASPAPNLIIDVQGLGIMRSRNKILSGVNWQVEAGQHWVILGANGSGKTSLLSALTGYFTPTTARSHCSGPRTDGRTGRSCGRGWALSAPACASALTTQRKQ